MADDLVSVVSPIDVSPELTSSVGRVPEDLLDKIRSENLNVYRASPPRLREDVGQESQIAQDYRGRLVYELLQNADDAMAAEEGDACIRFELTDADLWVANSGRALDEADVRGLCGISASKKSIQGQKRRASIGHKGMGFKSVLEVTNAPEVFSTTVCFCFSPGAALRGVRSLVGEGILDQVSRAPVTRFPWPAADGTPEWNRLRLRGMNTAFRLPLRDKMTVEQRDRLASVLVDLPVTSLVFLKHIGRVEVDIRRSSGTRSFAWSVRREHEDGSSWKDVTGFAESGNYRVTLVPDHGPRDTFLLAYDADIAIGDHRGGLDEFTWDGVEYAEVSVAARTSGKEPARLKDEWRLFHVFLPTGEPCPYDLLVSGAFGSNLSRQEIRVEDDPSNYNRFLFRQAARVLRDQLLPKLLEDGATVVGCLRLLDRRVEPRSRCTTAAAQALYEEVVGALADLAFLPASGNARLAIRDCAVPPILADNEAGRSFRTLLPPDVSCGGRQLPHADLCGAAIGRVLIDHGAYPITADEAASLLASPDPSTSALGVHDSGKFFVDPVLSVLEQFWRGFGSQDRVQLVAAVRREALFPVALAADDTAKRISSQDASCFYPPRFLHGEVPLEGLCLLLQDLCWGDLTPKERTIELQSQMEAWKALFDIREFKFPEVMRASVLPSLDLDRDTEEHTERSPLHDLNRLAAICQLAGRTPNANAPLPYERLKTNRALFNLSRLGVPCRGTTDGDVKWIPAYKAYFGTDWLDSSSVECILEAGRAMGVDGLPEVPFLLGPDRFSGLLEQYRHLEEDEESEERGRDVGEDEVSIDEDDEVALDADDRERWTRFFQWLGVNALLRPVHFHDVEDRASGWLKTRNLRRPEGRAFQNVSADLWTRYTESVRAELLESDPERAANTVPYFYELHELEHLVAFATIAAAEPSAQFARALYEHLARHWTTLEKFSRIVVAQVPTGVEPARRKPARVNDDELTDAGPDLWFFRLQESAFCPTLHGPRRAAQTWLPTAEVQRRFGRRAKAGNYLVPALDVDGAMLKGKPRAFAQALGVRDELSPATFTATDARGLLDRLHDLYQASSEANQDLRLDLREVIRPACRNLVELLSGKAEDADGHGMLGSAMVLASDGHEAFRFFEATKVFYLDRRDTRERLVADTPIWTFVIEASPAARIVLTQIFGMRVLEESLSWAPKPGDRSFEDDRLGVFRGGLYRLAPYLLARVGADRTDDRLVRQDVRKLRDFIDSVVPVTSLDLGCRLDGKEIVVEEGSREAFVDLDGDNVEAFVVWGENPWPPDQREAETLAGALCDVLGAGYFESFIALLQSESPSLRERILRRAGAPLDIEDKRVLFQTARDQDTPETPPSEPIEPHGPKTVQPGIEEEPSIPAFPGGGDLNQDPPVRLYEPTDLLIEGIPLIIAGAPAHKDKGGNNPPAPTGEKKITPGGNGRFGGNTDLGKLDALGMWVALSFELGRLRRGGLPAATAFDAQIQGDHDHVLIFDVSSPEVVESARSKSNLFNTAIDWLQRDFHVVPDWPGFDILTLDTRLPQLVDRMIELKSSGVESRIQAMTWNEWKTARASTLRERFYLYLVGNLRADLTEAQPYIRTIRNPFEQMVGDVQVERAIQRKVQLAVLEFREAEHLDLSVRHHAPNAQAARFSALPDVSSERP